MKIKTNNVPRPVVCGYELRGSQRVQALDDYNFLKHEFGDAQFVVYFGYVHYLGNFVRCLSLDGWSGAECDSAWTGTLIRIVDDETVVMGRYAS